MVDELISNRIRDLSVEELLKRLVSFSILMENNQGIKHKVPRYVLEKFERCILESYPANPLDQWNKGKYQKYLEFWRVEE